MRTGRDNYEVPKCCDNIVKTTTDSNSPLNRCIPRFRDEDIIECQFSLCGCNFRATDRSQLIVHNEENIHRHMNVSIIKTKNSVISILSIKKTIQLCLYCVRLFLCSDDDAACNKSYHPHHHHHKRFEIYIIDLNDK